MNVFRLKTRITKTRQVNINVPFQTLKLVTSDRNIDFSFSCNKNNSNVIRNDSIVSSSTFLKRQAKVVFI